MKKRAFAVVPPTNMALQMAMAFGPLAVAFVMVLWHVTKAPQSAWWLLPVMLVTTWLVWRALCVQRVRLGEDGVLRVDAGIVWTRVPAGEFELAQADIVNLENSGFRSGTKLIGGAMPGLKTGWFRAPGGARQFLLLTDTHQRALRLPKRDGSLLVLSLERPQALLDALQEVVAKHASR